MLFLGDHTENTNRVKLACWIVWGSRRNTAVCTPVSGGHDAEQIESFLTPGCNIFDVRYEAEATVKMNAKKLESWNNRSLYASTCIWLLLDTYVRSDHSDFVYLQKAYIDFSMSSQRANVPNAAAQVITELEFWILMPKEICTCWRKDYTLMSHSLCMQTYDVSFF